MGSCELCGRESGLARVEIEGIILSVCPGCTKFGKVLGEVKTEEEIKRVLKPKKAKTAEKEEPEEVIVGDFGEKIRKARERRGMKQEEFAKLLNERESVVQKWEGGSLKPGIERGKGLERILGIKLVEKMEEGKEELAKIKSGETTLGDVIKVRKR